jgi:hypothetical protein
MTGAPGVPQIAKSEPSVLAGLWLTIAPVQQSAMNQWRFWILEHPATRAPVLTDVALLLRVLRGAEQKRIGRGRKGDKAGATCGFRCLPLVVCCVCELER